MARPSRQPQGSPATPRPEQFARVHGSPGEAPRVAGLLRVGWPFLLNAVCTGYLLRAAWPWPPMPNALIGASFLALAGALAVSVTVGRERLQSFIKGARGEEWVARTLSFLPAEYRVYHGLSEARGWLRHGADYDHVVVGPSGLFLVETKFWAGTIAVRDGRIMCDGEEPDRPPLEQVKESASVLRQQLSTALQRTLDVQAVLCFVGGSLTDGLTGSSGVVICNGDTLLDVLQEKQGPPLARAVRQQVAQYLDNLMKGGY